GRDPALWGRGARLLSCRCASQRCAGSGLWGGHTPVSGTRRNVAGDTARCPSRGRHGHGSAVSLADALPPASSHAESAGLFSGASPPEALSCATGAAPADWHWGGGSGRDSSREPALEG